MSAQCTYASPRRGKSIRDTFRNVRSFNRSTRVKNTIRKTCANPTRFRTNSRRRRGRTIEETFEDVLQGYFRVKKTKKRG